LVVRVLAWVDLHVLAIIHSAVPVPVLAWVDKVRVRQDHVHRVQRESADHAQVATAVHVLQVQVALAIAQVAIAVHVLLVQARAQVLAVHVRVARQAVSMRVAVPLLVDHLVKAQLVVAVTRLVLSAAAVSQVRLASPSAHVVKNSTTCQHQYSVEQRFRLVTARRFVCHAVHRSLTLLNALAQTQQHSSLFSSSSVKWSTPLSPLMMTL
jgi:hypothetical protein